MNDERDTIPESIGAHLNIWIPTSFALPQVEADYLVAFAPDSPGARRRYLLIRTSSGTWAADFAGTSKPTHWMAIEGPEG